ncbi:hypothetical protein ACFFLZ_07065 [Photobacterium aphoticum]|uniref:Transcriptional regulator n=1 Tax=Photobacterium aphoticum TaxID=754436 RepID=A0A0J1JJA4_9GAMM|nr:hypothetical protein [Photobacterium aphoticum]KLV02102.1 hypothetical protein ABT58_06960 [Photobacterium aphoticum]PSU60357.1 hypothetical protein C9I90_01715 [Photobacterium aphoticum]GHA35193.1 hypothetical protein GCM10007086_06010 [Photobacterium aphoticum]
MTDIVCWLEQLKADLRLLHTPSQRANQADNQAKGQSRLVYAVSHTPAAIFGPIHTEQHSEALAYWFEACQQLHRLYHLQGDSDMAYSYQQFAYSKLQALASDPEQDTAMKRWCLKKLDRMVVSMMEFCQQQSSPQWEQEGAALVELHVLYMQGQQHMNMAYAHSQTYR